MVTAPPTTADGTSRPQTVSSVTVPVKLKPGLNVYHPKPIPPPEMLPLTRTVSVRPKSGEMDTLTAETNLSKMFSFLVSRDFLFCKRNEFALWKVNSFSLEKTPFVIKFSVKDSKQVK